MIVIRRLAKIDSFNFQVHPLAEFRSTLTIIVTINQSFNQFNLLDEIFGDVFVTDFGGFQGGFVFDDLDEELDAVASFAQRRRRRLEPREAALVPLHQIGETLAGHLMRGWRRRR